MSTPGTSAGGNNNSGIIISKGGQDESCKLDIHVKHTDGRAEPVSPAPWWASYLWDIVKWAGRLGLAATSVAGTGEIVYNIIYNKPLILQFRESDSSDRDGEAACSQCDEEPTVVETIYRIEPRCDGGRSSQVITAQDASDLLTSCPMQPTHWRELDARFFGEAGGSAKRISLQMGMPAAWRLREVRAFVLSWTHTEAQHDRFSGCDAAFEKIIRMNTEISESDRCSRPEHFRIVQAEVVRPLPQASEH
ncbi:MAG: hypothetical protein AAF788_05280 [Pseudomonadota bacterium]